MKPTLKKVHAFPKVIPQGKKRDLHPSNNLLVFCEKTTGTAQFCSESNGTPGGGLDRMASLLAMQCLVAGMSRTTLPSWFRPTGNSRTV